MKNKTLRREYTSMFFKGNSAAYFVMISVAILLGVLNLIALWLIQPLVDTVSGIPGSMKVGVLAILAVGMILLNILLKGFQYVAQPRFFRKQ